MQLTQFELDEYFKTDSISRRDEIESLVLEKMDSILKILYIDKGFKLDHWYFDDAREGEVGTLNLDDEIDNITCEPYESECFGPRGVFFLKWLTMTNEEIIEEINNDEKRIELEKAEAKVKAKASKDKKNKLIQSALLKLTEDERKAIGFNKAKAAKHLKVA